MKRLLPLISLLALAACATQPMKIMESEWTSMTKTNVPQLKDVTEVGPVQGKFCPSAFKSGHYGLMDEAISQAQKKHDVDYIRNATFMMDPQNSCVSVEGIGYKSKKI